MVFTVKGHHALLPLIDWGKIILKTFIELSAWFIFSTLTLNCAQYMLIGVELWRITVLRNEVIVL